MKNEKINYQVPNEFSSANGSIVLEEARQTQERLESEKYERR